MCRHQNAGQNYSLLTANKSFGNMDQIKYFGTTEQIKFTFTKKLTTDLTWGMLATILFRVSYLSVPSP
jgi:hypothetical protein